MISVPASRLRELVEALSDGATTPSELAERSLRAARVAGNAFITVDESVLESAREADERRRAGRPLSLIDGIPTALKDVISTGGLRTTMASAVFADHVPHHDAAIVQALRDAGALIVGKTNAQEFSYGIQGDIGAFGAVANPHDPQRLAGGSSSGSAAAVALGVVPFAVGTDTAGSVRVPAALCGAASFKPTLGRISDAGVFPLSPSFDTVGLIAGTADDLELLMAATGLLGDSAEPADAAGPDRILALHDLRAAVVDEPAGAPFDEVVHRLGTTPFSLAEIGVDVAELARLYHSVRAVEALEVHRELVREHSDRYQPEVLAKIGEGRDVPRSEYRSARARIDELRRIAAERVHPADVLVSPTVPVLAPRFDGPRRGEELMSLCVVWSVLGWPALTIPLRVPGCRLPQSLQLVAPPGQDHRLLSAGVAIERRLHALHPDTA